MKKLLSLVCGFTALMFASCASDEPVISDQNGPVADGDVYATVQLRLPASDTRSKAGEEIGQDKENTVGKIYVILATKTENGQYAYLTSAISDAHSTGSGNTYKYTLNFKSSELTPDPLDQTQEGTAIPNQEVYVFVFCNPTKFTMDNFEGITQGTIIDNKYAEISNKDNAAIWSDNTFLMTNCEIKEEPILLPSRAELIAKHNTPETAFKLGEVKVKRVCARFDFATTGDNRYEIKDMITPEKVVGVVELTDMALFNIQKQIYYFPHVSDTWSWTTPTVVNNKPNYTLCGDLEGYVMSYGSFKSKSSLSLQDIRREYYSPIIDNPLSMDPDSDLKWTSIRPTDWNKNAEDKNEGWTEDPKSDYRIWRYTTENTIPAMASGEGVRSQRQGITTGVVFKGVFEPANTDVWNGHVIYTYKNIVFGDLKALKEYIAKNPETNVAADFKQVDAFKNANVETDLDKNLMDGLRGDARHGFKAYPATDGKYIMYYFYYNRHNDNYDNSVMQTNEFGVVRNNVYKLKVTKVGTLGEPKAPNNPDEPDEQENAYFTVSCYVMPWTVRLNNIEF